MKNLIKTTLVLSILSLGVAVVAHAQPMTPQQRAEWSLKVRQSVFTLLGNNIGVVGGMARGQVDYDAEKATAAVDNIHFLSRMIPDAMAHDTREFELTTNALPEVWEDMDSFVEKAQNLTNAAANAQTLIAEGAEESDIRKALGGIGQACGSCHDDFKFDDR